MAEAKGLPYVNYSDQNVALCSEPGAAFIKEGIEKENLDRIVLCACTPKTHQPVFHAVLKEAGLPARNLEFLNIREHASFVHMKEEEAAQKKAIELITGAVGRAALLEKVPTRTVTVKPEACIIGGGIAGISAALDLANEGFQVYLIEKDLTIGGNMAKLDRIFPTDDCCI